VPAELLLREVRVLDPREGIDSSLDVRVSSGRIAELGEGGSLQALAGEEECIEGQGRLMLLPAFFDPHVHLRTPGQEHKEDLQTGTRAAAACWRCPTPIP
jgi:dihydroorotase